MPSQNAIKLASIAIKILADLLVIKKTAVKKNAYAGLVQGNGLTPNNIHCKVARLLNPNATMLKKIDRIMSNQMFLTQYNNANALFLPYGISDHSSTILKIPQVMKKKNKSFRLANYVTDKVEFKELVRMNWDINIQGHAMYKLVKKLKVLKPHLNKLNWKNGNLFGRVSELKAKLQTIQKYIDKDPTNKSLRAEGIEVLRDYKEATGDEEKLLKKKQKLLG
ncbi:hypothetical protein Tco_0747728 [Tanacetum coccineum]|uniref:Uncharacterized protein n=1 Tax=Tanacetum coccineum TaxID=301880 RepID=A0ABQ4YWB0_9ASTR